MTSTSQQIANRANAAKSTGPITEAGKAVSRRNALKHGLTSDAAMLLEGEDVDEHKSFTKLILTELDPQTLFEIHLARRVTSLLWRGRRIEAFESAIFSWMAHCCEEHYDLDRSETRCNGKSERLQAFHQGLKLDDDHRPPEEQGKLILGRLLHEAMNTGMIDKLSRYEAHLLGQLRRALGDLDRAQTMRRKRIEEKEMSDFNRALTYGPEPGKTW